MTKYWQKIWSNLGKMTVNGQILKDELASAHLNLRRILRELFTLFPTVYILLYFYDQILAENLVKVGLKIIF
jgi:hypothetical protein